MEKENRVNESDTINDLKVNKENNSASKNDSEESKCKNEIKIEVKNSVGGLNSVAEVVEETDGKPVIPNLAVSSTTVSRRMPHLHKLEK